MFMVYLLEQASLVENTSNCAGIEVPNNLFNLVAIIINGIKIVVPILLIIWGMLDFAKAIIAKKEEDIKKHQKMFWYRLISALLVFFIIYAVQLVFNLMGSVNEKSGNKNGNDSLWECSKKFIIGVEPEETTVESQSEK